MATNEELQAKVTELEGLLRYVTVDRDRYKGALTLIQGTATVTLEGNPTAFFKRMDELDLSVRSANILQNAGIEYIWQLVELTEAKFLKLKNSGRMSLNEIKELLGELGLSLKTKEEPHRPRRLPTDVLCGRFSVYKPTPYHLHATSWYNETL